MIEIFELLSLMEKYNASDMIIKEDTHPVFRINKDLARLETDIISKETINKYLQLLCNEKNYEKLLSGEEIDFAFVDKEIGRFRINAFYEKTHLAAVIRYIKTDIVSFKELLLPEILYDVAGYQNGIVLITGTAGSGKSTTLASIINYINTNYAKHIITIEDPIEYIYKDINCVITQREIGIDTKDCQTALKSVLRQSPDIIVIGEMRDSETIMSAITAAETGHLVFSTLHTANTVQSLDRILEYFPAEQKEQVLYMMSDTLRSVISQSLIPKIDGTGVVPAIEVLIKTPTIQKIIRENRFDQIQYHIHNGIQDGMQTFDQSIIQLYKAGFISYDDASKKCSRPALFDRFCQGYFPNIE